MPAASQAEIEGQHLEEGEPEETVPRRSGACRIATGILASVAVAAIVVAIVTKQGSGDGGDAGMPSMSSGSHSLGDRVAAGIWAQKKMPLTTSAAMKEGWSVLDNGACHGKYGVRYRLGARLTPTLMFDNLGTLVGMQITVNTIDWPLYPESNLKDDFITGEDEAGLTLHFTDPDSICTAKNTLDSGSVGNRLWVRTENGFETIPLKITDTDQLPSGYAPSGCAASGFAFPNSPGMGVHYWRGLQGPEGKDLACIETGPMFLLYNDQQMLTAFGLTYVSDNYRVPTVGNVEPVKNNRGSYYNAGPNDELWEFAQQSLSPYFFKEEENPTCLKHLNTFGRENKDEEFGQTTTGTLHVFVTDPYNIACPSE